MKVLLAPDKFKGSASARQVAAALARGISLARPDVLVRQHPMADGGDGTVTVLLQHGFRPVSATVRGPLSGRVLATYAVRGQHAVIEAARACGLALLPDGPSTESARLSTTFGVGELIDHAKKHGARVITVAVGGSASTDGGAGALQAMGALVLDRDGRAVAEGGAALLGAAFVDLSQPISLLGGVELLIACDVDNPLTGRRGSAPVYSAQKGATASDTETLSRALVTWSEVVASAVGCDIREDAGTGAAGGLAFGLAAMGGRIVSGSDLMMELTELAHHLAEADLVVVAEGSLDEQSLNGKGPAGLARRATELGVPVIAVAGRCTLTAEQAQALGLRAVHTLSELEPDVGASMRHAETLLERVGEVLAADLADL